jgi:nuclear migration protein JNM1
MELSYVGPGLSLQTANLLQTTTVRTASDSDDDLGANPDIDRQGVNADEARSHFLGASVDAREANFSDSIATKRKAYRAKSHRRRRHDGGSEDVGDISDDEDEGVERKLARLQREVEELKDEMAARDSGADGSNQAPPEEKEKLGDGVAELSRAVDNLHVSRGGPGPYSAAAMLAQKLAADSPVDSSEAGGGEKPPAAEVEKSTPAPTGLLNHAAAFDGRLALIEAAMGISSSSNPFTPDSSSESARQPVLPALDHLTSRLSSLTNILVGPSPASAVSTTGPSTPSTTMTTPHLESLASRVRKLTADTDALASARKRAIDNAKAAQTARIQSAAVDRTPDMEVGDPASTEDDSAAAQRDEQASKIQALYATLPTIQSLHPLLPSVLERLRSLRAIHAGAAQASESLDELERRQADMKREVEQWREGLKTVEEKMGQGEAAMKNNVETVEPWVRDLEKRMDGLKGSEVR